MKKLIFILFVCLLSPLKAEIYDLSTNEENNTLETIFADLANNIGQMFRSIDSEDKIKNNISNIIANAIFLVCHGQESGINLTSQKCKEIINSLEQETRNELNKFLEYNRHLKKITTQDSENESEKNSYLKCDGNSCSIAIE